jgi:hypothetical protein
MGVAGIAAAVQLPWDDEPVWFFGWMGFAATCLVLGVICAGFAETKLSESLFYICNRDGSITPHFRPGALGASTRQVQELVDLFAAIHDAVSEGRLPPDQRLRIISRLAGTKLMTRLGFASSPTSWTERWSRATAYCAFAALAGLRRWRPWQAPHPRLWEADKVARKRRAVNWRSVWSATAGEVTAAVAGNPQLKRRLMAQRQSH